MLLKSSCSCLMSFSLQGHDIVVRRYVSPSCGSRESLYALSTSNRYRWRVPDIKSSPQGTKSPLSQTFSRSTEIQKQESVDSITASSRSRESSSRETWRTAHTQRQLSGKASMSRSQAAPSSFSDRDMLTEEDVQVEVDHEQPSSLDRDSLVTVSLLTSTTTVTITTLVSTAVADLLLA